MHAVPDPLRGDRIALVRRSINRRGLPRAAAALLGRLGRACRLCLILCGFGLFRLRGGKENGMILRTSVSYYVYFEARFAGFYYGAQT